MNAEILSIETAEKIEKLEKIIFEYDKEVNRLSKEITNLQEELKEIKEEKDYYQAIVESWE